LGRHRSGEASLDSTTKCQSALDGSLSVKSAMRPQMLTIKNVAATEAALARFYRARPVSYGLEERDSQTYENYSRFVSEYATRPDLPCVDLGCGTHRSPLTLARYGFGRVVGIDIFSDSDLDRFSSEITVDGVTLKAYDGRTLPFESGSVGTVASLCVLEHVVRVGELLGEIDRVLAPGGSAIIVGPNWSGISNPLRALMNRRRGAARYWQFETLEDCALGLVRSIWWWLKLKTSRKATFILIEPRCDAAGEIDFEYSDDDAVHLCQPLSFKYWFESRRYRVQSFNQRVGTTPLVRIFNRCLPGLATSNELAFEKPWSMDVRCQPRGGGIA
jgi:SAM-dependent methyltransferase